MKKTFTLLAAVFAFGANAQTYFEDDFEGASLTANNAWNIQEVTPAPTFSFTWYHDSFSGNFFAEITNYDSPTMTNEACEIWLITPAIDLQTATNPSLNFDNMKRFPGDDLEVLVSTDYDGTSDPTGGAFNWTDITSSLTMDNNDGSWNFVNSGNFDMTSYAGNNTVYIAFKYVGGASDGSVYEIDNVLVNEGGAVPNPPVAIYDIQYATAAPFASAYDGQTVTTYGYVTGVYADGYFIQDSSSAWNGLMVYDPSSSNLPAIGDSITVEGDIDEFNELTQLVFPTSMTVESSGHSVTPVMVSANNANNEEYEGCYVMVSTATVTQTGLPGNQFEVNDGSGVLLVDDLLYSVSATVGNVYDLAGVMYYSFSERKLEPTSSNDVSDITGFVANEFVNVEVFPTAVDEAMVVTGANDMLVEIFNVNGQIVASERISNDRFEFDLSDLSAGMYTVRMQAGNKAHSVRIVKK